MSNEKKKTIILRIIAIIVKLWESAVNIINMLLGQKALPDRRQLPWHLRNRNTAIILN